MSSVSVDKSKLKDTVQQLKVLCATHEKTLQKCKYNVPLKLGLNSEIKTIKKLLKYYEDLNL